jgi:hypothetical protein
MSIRNRLSKLEAAAGAGNKPLFEMSDAELEHFLRKHLSLAEGTPITDEMLLQVALGGDVVASKYTHEEALQMMPQGVTA